MNKEKSTFIVYNPVLDPPLLVHSQFQGKKPMSFSDTFIFTVIIEENTTLECLL